MRVRVPILPNLAILATVLMVPGVAALPVRAVDASVGFAHSSLTRSHGLEIRLSTARGSYPRDVLVAVTLTFHNIGSHAVRLLPLCRPGTAEDQWTVNLVRGEWRMPLGPPIVSSPRCLGALHLAPGQWYHRTNLVVLSGPQVRAEIYQQPNTTNGQPILSHPLTLRLTAGARPRVRLTQGPIPQARITPPPGARGRLHYAEWIDCGADQGLIGVPVSFWRIAKGQTIAPLPQKIPCSHIREWQAVAGWIGHPAVVFDYRRFHRVRGEASWSTPWPAIIPATTCSRYGA